MFELRVYINSEAKNKCMEENSSGAVRVPLPVSSGPSVHGLQKLDNRL